LGLERKVSDVLSVKEVQSMTDNELLTKVKAALGITGDFQDETLQVYIADVKAFMLGAGVPLDVVQSPASVGCISRGVADLTGLLNNNLSKITVDSSVKALDAYSLYNKNLTEVRIKSATAIGLQALALNPSLYHVIIETNSVCSLGDEALMATSVGAGAGWIYVPSDLVDSYKSSWVDYADQIVSLDEYPKEITITETISDSWEDIFAAEEDDSYKTKYSVGDTKVLDINGVKAIMQIVAFDTDSLSDNSGTAKISWLCKNVPFIFSMNPNNSIVGGWEDTLCRDRLINDVLLSLKVKLLVIVFDP
jgi:hypothetical protein